MAAFRRLYGASPVHLLALLASLVLTAVALGPLLDARTLDVATWFAAGAVLHDLLVLPIYVVADAAVVALWRRRPGRVSWLNFVRIPLAVSGLLLLVYSPVILRQASSFELKTGRQLEPYLGRWLLACAILAAVSATWYAVRMLIVRRSDRAPA